MKLKFKIQQYQTNAVQSVVDCFQGQVSGGLNKYTVDPGNAAKGKHIGSTLEDDGFKNADLQLTEQQLLSNIQLVQRRQNLPQSPALVTSKVCKINLDVEMETGTGKTYCYIKTIFELNKLYGWSKFIIVVPSIAIREGVYKSLEITADHFLETYHKKAQFFIYNSKQLHNIENFSTDASINVMVINMQAFGATGKDNRKIYEEIDSFQSRKPIDVISANRPILILDEPQKIGEGKTFDALQYFKPLMILRYSATHKKTHNKIHRLDALDAYNQKLVKKINVRGISIKGLTGTNAYLYLESIQISSSKPPEARVEIEIKQSNGIKRITRKLGKRDNLHIISDLEQYKGFVVADIDANTDTLSFTNGAQINVGEAVGDTNESTLRRIQIRETIKAHLDKEQVLFYQGIKVLSLFFIDEVAKYRDYSQPDQHGEYAHIFEEEYNKQINELLSLEDSSYNKYLKNITTPRTHEGYFSIDKKSKRQINPSTGARSTEADDVDAYDLILRKKEQLLKFEEPVRFIFSHSALREGWDNPNVFVICTLKHSDNTVTKRQEVGRGLRLSINQNGDRMDDPATVHQLNVLTIVANESYKDFVSALQKDISDSLSDRPRVADKAYFTGKIFNTATGDVTVTPEQANHIEFYLIQNGYVDTNRKITEKYHQALKEGSLAELPEELKLYNDNVYELINTVFTDNQLPDISDDRKAKVNPINQINFTKKEFIKLWNSINRKAAYTVEFETIELIAKCIAALNLELKASPLQYTIQEGIQKDDASLDNLKQGEGFKLTNTTTETNKFSVHSAVKYDLLGKLSSESKLTRKTIATILQGISPETFLQYKVNPEDFIAKSIRLINEQKATMIVEHISYNPIDETHDLSIFTQDKPKEDFNKAFKANRHVYDYVFTDSKNERSFVTELDSSTEVVVYAKLPNGFSIPTPVGNYNPDWAIAFTEDVVKHVYFVAETKGSMSSMELREIEKSKINCARKFFSEITSDKVKYEVVDSYSQLISLVK
jgi:type III restriction enzyme